MTDEHNTAAQRVRFGTVDWRHPAWQGSYYPDDLPEDWQLGYYANELSATLVDAPGGSEELQTWAAEAHDDFRFYLMLDAAADAAPQLARARELGQLLGGALWPHADAPEGTLTPVDAALPPGVRAWGEGDTVRVAVMDLAGLDLRARRGVLDALAPRLAGEGDVALLLAGDSADAAAARELQTVAELMGIA